MRRLDDIARSKILEDFENYIRVRLHPVSPKKLICYISPVSWYENNGKDDPVRILELASVAPGKLYSAT